MVEGKIHVGDGERNREGGKERNKNIYLVCITVAHQMRRRVHGDTLRSPPLLILF